MPRARRQQLLLAAGIFLAGVAIDHAFVAKQDMASSSHELAVTNAATPIPIAGASDTFASFTREQPSAADAQNRLASILAERNPQQRMAALQAYIASLSRGEFADALKRLQKIPGSTDRSLASRLLIARWVEADPNGALQFAASNPHYEDIAENVFQHEAATDLQSAIERALSLPNPDLRYQALRGVVSYMADTDPAGALALAEKAGEFPGNEPLNSVAYREWATTDPANAAKRAAEDPSGDGWRSPVGQVVRTWAGQDPAAAASWSLSLSDPQAQSRAVGQVVRQWARADVTAATNWINGLPPGAAHDSASAAVAYSIASADPQAAVNWIQNIQDETAKTTALQRLSQQVMWRDPANGSATLQAAGVPAELIPPARQGPPRGGRRN